MHASSAARFEEGYRRIADTVRLHGRDEKGADILRLVSVWLHGERKGKWVLILDNSDNREVCDRPDRGAATASSPHPPLLQFITQSNNGAILITSRERDAAELLTGDLRDIITIRAMDKRDAMLLRQHRLREHFDRDTGAVLVQLLDYMPLAISRAAACICKRVPYVSSESYIRALQKSDESTTSLLNYYSGDLRRDANSSNSIITTWQISFEHLNSTRPSAAELLSDMSHFDSQGIPRFLLQKIRKCKPNERAGLQNSEKSAVRVKRKVVAASECDEDIVTLLGYCLITEEVAGSYSMHPLVQLSLRTWMKLQGQLEIRK